MLAVHGIGGSVNDDSGSEEPFKHTILIEDEEAASKKLYRRRRKYLKVALVIVLMIVVSLVLTLIILGCLGRFEGSKTLHFLTSPTENSVPGTASSYTSDSSMHAVITQEELGLAVDGWDWDRTLIVISIDGFRPSYLRNENAKNLVAFGTATKPSPNQNGKTVEIQPVIAPAMLPQLPTYTFPNHYSIVTGLYAEAHGILGNEFFDASLNATFAYKDPLMLDSKWWKEEPIWNSIQYSYLDGTFASRNDISPQKDAPIRKKSAIAFWPGSEALINGLYPTYFLKYDAGYSQISRMEHLLRWLELPVSSRPHLLMSYLDVVDRAGHQGGTKGPHMDEAIRQVDEAIAFLMKKLEERNLLDKLNIIILSDHGMQDIRYVISLQREGLLSYQQPNSDIARIDFGPIAIITFHELPDKASRIDALFVKLKAAEKGRFKTFKSAEIPRDWHMFYPARIGDIMLICRPHFIFADDDWGSRTYRGAHGFLFNHHYSTNGFELSHLKSKYSKEDDIDTTDDMMALFMARGPRISLHPSLQRLTAVQYLESSKKVSNVIGMRTFENLDVYPLMCHVLGIPARPNNGTDYLINMLSYNA